MHQRKRAWGISGLMVALLVASSVRTVSAGPASPSSGSDREDGWDLALTGGLIVNGLTDPVWALEPIPGRIGRFVVREDTKESTTALGIALFGQVYHARLPWLAPSIGIGVRNDGRATLYVGPALRLGRRASLTGGIAVGPVAALPAGVQEGQTLIDTNFLSALGSRNIRSWFFGATYTFTTIH